MTFTIEHLSIPKAGEQENGDAVVVRQEGDQVLLAVIDALGHGPPAASVAKLAVEHLRKVSMKTEASAILEGLHTSLRASRGAAATVCTLGPGRLTGCGVGNVDMRSYGTRISAVLNAGVIGGGRLGRLRMFESPLVVGDRFMIFTDGISPRFDGANLIRLPAAEACRAFMDRYRRVQDDATVLIAHVQA